MIFLIFYVYDIKKIKNNHCLYVFALHEETLRLSLTCLIKKHVSSRARVVQKPVKVARYTFQKCEINGFEHNILDYFSVFNSHSILMQAIGLHLTSGQPCCWKVNKIS